MRTMSGSPCLHYDCSNRNSFGYCKTTVCVNEHYQREQWGIPSTINKSESVVIKQQTNADRIRAMNDEELDRFFSAVQWDVANYCGGVTQKQEYPIPEQRGACLDWLKQEASDD